MGFEATVAKATVMSRILVTSTFRASNAIAIRVYALPVANHRDARYNA
jgi:hypothetical protein